MIVWVRECVMNSLLFIYDFGGASKHFLITFSLSLGKKKKKRKGAIIKINDRMFKIYRCNF